MAGAQGKSGGLKVKNKNGAEKAYVGGEKLDGNNGWKSVRVKIFNLELKGKLHEESGIVTCSDTSQVLECVKNKNKICVQSASLASQFDKFKASVRSELEKRDVEIESMKRILKLKFENQRYDPTIKKPVRCWKCLELGHERKFCPQNQKNGDEGGVEGAKEEQGRENSVC